MHFPTLRGHVTFYVAGQCDVCLSFERAAILGEIECEPGESVPTPPPEVFKARLDEVHRAHHPECPGHVVILSDRNGTAVPGQVTELTIGWPDLREDEPEHPELEELELHPL